MNSSNYITIPVHMSGDPTVSKLVSEAIRVARAAGLEDVAYFEHGVPRTVDGVRSLTVVLSTSTPCEYNRTGDQIILL